MRKAFGLTKAKSLGGFAGFLEILLNDTPGQSRRVRPEFSPGVDRGVDSRVNSVGDYRAELAQSRVDQFPSDHGLVVLAIVATVGGNPEGGWN